MHRTYTRTGKMAFWIVVEVLEIVGFAVGFYAIINTPVNNMNHDLASIHSANDQSVLAIKDELTILVDSTISSRTMGFIAMVLIVSAFILRTIVGRVIHMPS